MSRLAAHPREAHRDRANGPMTNARPANSPHDQATLSLAHPIDWIVAPGPVDYEAAVAAMERRVAAIADGTAREAIWLLEHPPLYTAGTSAKPADLLTPERFPVFKTGRGGQYTYHGPGQRIAYVMLDVKRRTGDVRSFVHTLEEIIIAALAGLGVKGEVREGRVGVWVSRAAGDGGFREDKIAALGIRVRKWVSFHGLSINVAPHLDHFDGIVPCGIREHGVTSLADLGTPHCFAACDAALKDAFEARFGLIETVDAAAP
jgi:lipoyl(octanoyl) transferase